MRTASSRRGAVAGFLSLSVVGVLSGGTRAQRVIDVDVGAGTEQRAPRDVFWSRLESLCGQAFGGRLVIGSPADSIFRISPLVMHVRSCSASELRIPFHVGANRSRTWVVTRTADGLRLKHDHRHEDGSEDRVTQYGGETRDSGSVTRQDFPADDYTATLLPSAKTAVWTMEIEPNERFAYSLRRIGTERHVRIEFDLTQKVPPPPPPWGAKP